MAVRVPPGTVTVAALAPRLQPRITTPETTGAQHRRMGDIQGDTEPLHDEELPALPDLKPWAQIGWIFRDGDCVAIERQGEATRRCSRVLAD
jgi:hypothetical protein